MAKVRRKSERREEALSPEQIIAAAIELLDEEGEEGLTFRALAGRLETGAGALYWHIANKGQLLAAAADAVIRDSLSQLVASSTPQEAIRHLALAVYTALDTHPWVGTQLSRTPGESAMVRIFEQIGRQVQALGARDDAQFTAGSTLVSYILGVSIQNAANARLLEPPVDRNAFLQALAARWKQLDPNEFPFIRNVVAARLPDHDDQEEFLAGLDLILAGIAASL